MTSTWDLTNVAEAAIAFRDERDWQQFHRPRELAAALNIEASELLELFLWKGDESAQALRDDRERLTKVEQEVADVVIYAVTLCHDLGIDLAGAVQEKLRLNGERYTVEGFRGSAKKAASAD